MSSSESLCGVSQNMYMYLVFQSLEICISYRFCLKGNYVLFEKAYYILIYRDF
jgi:hypothetical protein